MKKLGKFALRNLIPFLVFILLVLPVVASSEGLVPPCSTHPTTKQCVWGWNEFIGLIDNVIKFILVSLAIPVAAIMFAYAGILMITGGGESAKAREKAKKIVFGVIKGLLWIGLAWLAVKFFFIIFGYKGTWIGF